ncbi:MAG: hypothetical protein Q8S84_00195 [bacterium]|nr:hypothetical protein [bacterium]MDP3380010.1 hypothetical protein [bacterium]
MFSAIHSFTHSVLIALLTTVNLSIFLSVNFFIIVPIFHLSQNISQPCVVQSIFIFLLNNFL